VWSDPEIFPRDLSAIYGFPSGLCLFPLTSLSDFVGAGFSCLFFFFFLQFPASTPSLRFWSSRPFSFSPLQFFVPPPPLTQFASFFFENPFPSPPLWSINGVERSPRFQLFPFVPTFDFFWSFSLFCEMPYGGFRPFFPFFFLSPWWKRTSRLLSNLPSPASFFRSMFGLCSSALGQWYDSFFSRPFFPSPISPRNFFLWPPGVGNCFFRLPSLFFPVSP